MARARKAAETAEAEATAAGTRETRGAGRRGEARHRGRDPALARADPQGGRRPDRAGDRESHPQEPHRRGPEAARRGGPRRGRLLRALGVGELTRCPTPPAYTPTPSSRPARRKASSTRCSEQLGQFADAVDGNRDLQVFLFSPYLSSAEKSEGLGRAISGAEPEFDQLPRAAGREAPDAGDLPHPARVRRALEEGEPPPRRDRHQRRRARPEPWSSKIGEEVERQTGEKVELSSRVDDEILGGIVLQVGNMVLDASIRSRLEKLRKSVASAA